MTGTVVTHKTQVGQSSTAANNFTIRTLDDGSLRVSRGNAGAEISDVLVIDANGNFSTAPVLGVGQTWQNVTVSRAVGVTYTNSTGRPIVVSSQAATTNNLQNIGIKCNGVDIARVYNNNSSGGVGATVQAIIPNGSTYIVDSTAPIALWMELR